jgi:hypothetical protein
MSKKIKLALQLLITLGVLMASLNWTSRISADIKIDVKAISPKKDLWKLVFDYGPRLRRKGRRERIATCPVPASPNPQIISFSLPASRRFKRLRLYPGHFFNKNMLEKGIQYIRFTAVGHHLDLKWNPEEMRKQGFITIRDNFQSLYSQLYYNSTRRIVFFFVSAAFSLLTFLLLQWVMPGDFRHLFRLLRVSHSRSPGKHVSISLLSTLLFLSIISLPMLYSLIGGKNSDIAVNNAEKRVLAKKPIFNPANPLLFPRQYTKFYNDHFSFRNLLIRWQNLIHVKLFEISPVPKVIIGKDGWLFYRSELQNDGNTIEDFEGNLLYSPAQLDKIKKNIEYKAAWFKRRNIVFLIILVPNKETIYSELLPSSIKKGKTRRQQLNELFKRNPHLPVMDITDELLKRKQSEQIYYSGGTHWNQIGAYYGYKAIMSRLAKDAPNIPFLTPFPIDAFNITVEENSPYDHWFGFHDHKHILLTLKPSIRKASKYRKKPKAIAFRDSFIKYFPHFYRNHFSPFLEISNHGFSFPLVKQQKPDLVIWEIIERSSHLLLE